jgi:hypothetical protein
MKIRLMDIAVLSVAFGMGRQRAKGYILGRDALTSESIESRACRHGASRILFHVEDATRCLREGVLLAERYRKSGQMRGLDRLILSLLRRSLSRSLTRFEPCHNHQRRWMSRSTSESLVYMSRQAHKCRSEAICGCGRCRMSDSRKQPQSVSERPGYSWLRSWFRPGPEGELELPEPSWPNTRFPPRCAAFPLNSHDHPDRVNVVDRDREEPLLRCRHLDHTAPPAVGTRRLRDTWVEWIRLRFRRLQKQAHIKIVSLIPVAPVLPESRARVPRRRRRDKVGNRDARAIVEHAIPPARFVLCHNWPALGTGVEQTSRYSWLPEMPVGAPSQTRDRDLIPPRKIYFGGAGEGAGPGADLFLFVGDLRSDFFFNPSPCNSLESAPNCALT